MRFEPLNDNKEMAQNIIGIIQDRVSLRMAKNTEIVGAGLLREKEVEARIKDRWKSIEKRQYFTGTIFGEDFFIVEVVTSRTWGLEESFIRHIKPLPGDCRITLKMIAPNDCRENHYLAYVALAAYLAAAMHVNRMVIYLFEDQREDATLLDGLGCTCIQLDTPAGEYDKVYIRMFTDDEKRMVNIVRTVP